MKNLKVLKTQVTSAQKVFSGKISYSYILLYPYKRLLLITAIFFFRKAIIIIYWIFFLESNQLLFRDFLDIWEQVLTHNNKLGLWNILSKFILQKFPIVQPNSSETIISCYFHICLFWKENPNFDCFDCSVLNS